MLAVSAKWVEDVKSLPYLPDDNTLDWVVKPYILSKALKQVSSAFTVKMLSQQLELPRLDECESYPDIFKQTQKAFVRQVLLCDGDKPLTFGRIVAPVSTYQAYITEMDTLGDKPFGEQVIYAHPNYRRSAFSYQHFTGFDAYEALIGHLGEDYRYHDLWGRRSLFYLGAHPLLVVELFMPHLPTYPQ